LLIASDNAAAKTIARELGEGRRSTFVGWMNEKVLEWGLGDTRFANSHGLDDQDAYTTAWDMAIIAREAMRRPDVRNIVRQDEAYVAGHWIQNTNELLPTYPGMVGVKTGTTDLAGECLIAMVERPSGNVLSVVLGSQDRFRDTRLLLDYYYGNYAEVHVDLADTEQNRYRDEAGNWRHLSVRDPTVLLISPWEVDTLSYYRRIDDISAIRDVDMEGSGMPEGSPTPVGVLFVERAARQLAEIPLYVR
jgi:D-alanyl-D-alanine carboxypeptidase